MLPPRSQPADPFQVGVGKAWAPFPRLFSRLAGGLVQAAIAADGVNEHDLLRKGVRLTARTVTAVIVIVSTLNHDGDEQTTYYGPFLPHAGSATTSFVVQLKRELEASGRFRYWGTTVEN